jgi:hypothetical protein
MIAVFNFLVFLAGTGNYVPVIIEEKACENITSVEIAIGCSTVNGRRVFHDAKFSF